VDAVHAQVTDAPLQGEYGALLGYSAELFAGLFITNAPTLSTWFTEVSKRSLQYPSRPKHRTSVSL
jgi:hypothetical protein